MEMKERIWFNAKETTKYGQNDDMFSVINRPSLCLIYIFFNYQMELSVATFVYTLYSNGICIHVEYGESLISKAILNQNMEKRTIFLFCEYQHYHVDIN